MPTATEEIDTEDTDEEELDEVKEKFKIDDVEG